MNLLQKNVMKILVFYFAILLASCQHEDEILPNNNPENLKGISLIDFDNFKNQTLSYDDLLPKKLYKDFEFIEMTSSTALSGLLSNLSEYSEISDQFQYDTDVYKMLYNIEIEGETIVASALVSIPRATNGEKFPILCLYDGTYSDYDDAPTFFGLKAYLLSGIACGGYITVIPDGIGFGSSAGRIHPYYQRTEQGITGANAVLAAKHLLRKLRKLEAIDTRSTGDLICAGYSAGGYSAMAAQRLIENNIDYSDVFKESNINLIGSACGAGGYDLKAMSDYIVAKGISSDSHEYAEPQFLANIGLSYSQELGGQQLLNSMFRTPYASTIPALFDGTKSGGEINQQLNTDLQKLYKPAFFTKGITKITINGGITGKRTIYTYDEKLGDFFYDLEYNNNLAMNWTPKTPLYLYHSEEDEIIPYNNSEKTVTALQGGEANVTLTSLEGTHSEAIAEFIKEFFKIEWQAANPS